MGAIANGWQDVERFRAILDTAAALVALAGLIPIVRLKLHVSLIMLYAVSLVWLAQASVAFLLSNPWDDLWWYGHFVSTGGIFILGYGAVNAFHALRLYDGVYSQDEILARLNEEKGKAEEALLQLRIANEELSRLATTDSLTGVNNRRQFMTTLGLEIARSKRTGAPLSLLMLDIDRFKLVNDTYGHPAGDKVLQAFAKVMLDSLRLLDHVGRLGGEEFAVLLPDTGYAVAYGVAERLREACAACIVIDDEGHEIRFTTSIGIAQFGRDGEMADQLISAADTRLYKAKHAGRNRVEA
jgi:diguanylate cyclase (GGDEF)-like protein